ncbi:hypothetical protein EUGRSUZ_H03296 [Eucalyptus grandis]|uniref:Uncharacterized protein n=2 Tax=Eucalyptus grandis TaxID=71139 RepID=A0ACC3JYA7_EUCGR|nr:hypothetical protein EUGRSUZ_H03296 [Eucalyptus grandis]
MQYLLLITLLLTPLSLSRSGHGQFTTVQQAIDSIPAKNNVWTRILVKPGIYKEKVVIPADKPCIVLQGRTASDTVIEWGDGGEVNKTATFTLYAENFKAKNIRFEVKVYLANLIYFPVLSENLIIPYNLKTPHGDRNSIRQAPAFQITSDKVSFYQCAFIGVQDTLTDFQGRHYFESCYIEGAVDFIWGNGQSIYKGCTINASTAILGGFTGYITAQGRDSATDTTGYIFEQCSVVGTGPVYLGRAYRQYSRVVFHKTHLSSVVVPKGWDPWTYVGRERATTYAESECTGPGADKSKRVEWEMTLSGEELYKLTDVGTFVNQGGWLYKQPY